MFTNATDASFGGENTFSNGVFVAQDFFLTDAASLTSFTFNAYTTAATVPITDVSLSIYADNAGAVGAQLYSGSFGTPTAAFTESLYLPDPIWDLYDFTVALPDWSLGAGVYWVGLNVGPTQTALHWSIPTDNLGAGIYGPAAPGDPSMSWQGDATGTPASYTNGYDWEHVFRFEGDLLPASVPDTVATAPLLAFLVSALGWLHFRRVASPR